MALVNCNECNAEISDQAISCPKCGCPIKGASEKSPVTILATAKKITER